MVKKLLMLSLIGVLYGESAEKKTNLEDEGVRRIVDRAFKAIGGEEKLAAISTARLETVFKSSDGKVVLNTTYLVQKPNRIRVETKGERNDQKYTSLTVLNGDNLWVEQDGKTQAVFGNSKERIKGILHSFPALYLSSLRQPHHKLSSLGNAVLNGQEVEGLRMQSDDNKESAFQFYFDKKTGLLIKREFWVKGKMEGEDSFSDFKDMDGVKIASKIVSRRDGKIVGERTTSYKLVKEIDPKLFEKP